MNPRFTLLVAGDPNQLTGGYIYDAQIVAALREQGVTVDVMGLRGSFPAGDQEAADQLANALDSLEEGSRVIIDGLAMGALPKVVANHSSRLQIISLLHHPLGDEQGISVEQQQRFHLCELEGLAHVDKVIVTSRFTQRRLQALSAYYGLPITAPIVVVEPGVARAPISPALQPDEPVRLLCVASLTPRKGQDILVQALAKVTATHWRCDCIGGARDARFTEKVQRLINDHDLSNQVILHGECDAERLAAAYQRAHALVLPSWYEGYGMVVTEALAHGLPVITTTGGALEDTLPGGAGINVAPGDIAGLQEALQRFFDSEKLRTSLRAGAISARGNLQGWQVAGAAFAAALVLPPAVERSSSSHFQSDWLMLREAADSQSRSQALANAANKWLASQPRPSCIADLGCGRGSNLWFLAPRFHHQQQWLLFDHDASLLSEANQRASLLQSGDGNPLSSVSICTSLKTLDHPDLSRAQLITASALLDLVSADWIEALAKQCAQYRQAILVAMSITGVWCFIDTQLAPVEHDEDRWVLGLFNAHQRRDKGVGDALGGEANDVLVRALKQQGFHVEQAETPWTLAPGDSEFNELIHQLIAGWAAAATEQAPEAAPRIAQWRNQRQQAVSDGELGVWVGHYDVLALPMDRG